jgi:hypothetical protein
VQACQARLGRKNGNGLLYLGQRSGQIPSGLQFPNLRHSLVHEFLAAAVFRQHPHAFRGVLARIQFKRLIH